MKVLAFLTDGFETVEALAVIDILRRANIGVDTVSITGNKSVKSAQNIIVEADKLIEDINCNDEDVCFLQEDRDTRHIMIVTSLLIC